MVAEAIPESAVCEVLNTPETNQDSVNAYCRSVFTFQKAMLWDKEPGVMEPGFYYEMYKNPGDYEIKVLTKRKARAHGKVQLWIGLQDRDNGIAKQNNLGTLRIVVPAQIIGDQDGQWDRTAYKTDAFFGNPLSGFTWP
jgi:hypothetical protein